MPVSRLRLLILLGAAGLRAACSSIEEKEITVRDDCRRCPPGVVSGSDGYVTFDL